MFRFSSNGLFTSAFCLAVVLAACGGPADPASDSSVESSAAPVAESGQSSTQAGETASTAAPDRSDALGEPLDHPERYYGLYASPDTPNRAWFVTEAKRPEHAEQAPEIPPGYLMMGAMFGDVAPWTLRSVSETEFVQAVVSEFQPEPVSIAFELGPDGDAVAMRFTDDSFADEGRLERTGDLPEEWQ